MLFTLTGVGLSQKRGQNLLNISFLKVLDGMDVVRKIENTKTDSVDKPIKEVVIVDCGAEQVSEELAVTKNSAEE